MVHFHHCIYKYWWYLCRLGQETTSISWQVNKSVNTWHQWKAAHRVIRTHCRTIKTSGPNGWPTKRTGVTAQQNEKSWNGPRKSAWHYKRSGNFLYLQIMKLHHGCSHGCQQRRNQFWLKKNDRNCFLIKAMIILFQ